jgi:hypothetical protein
MDRSWQSNKGYFGNEQYGRIKAHSLFCASRQILKKETKASGIWQVPRLTREMTTIWYSASVQFLELNNPEK